MLQCDSYKTRLPLTTLLFLTAGGLTLKASAEAVNCEHDPGTNMDVEYSDTVLCDFETNDDTDIFHFVGNKGDQPFIRLLRGTGAGHLIRWRSIFIHPVAH